VTTAAVGGGVFKRHLYRVTDGESAIRIETTLRNESSEPIKVSTRDDWMRFNETGTVTGGIRWADAINPAHRCGYALAVESVEGVEKWSENLDLAPGQQVTVRRVFAVGTSPAEAAGEAMRLTGAAVKPLSGRVTEGGQPATGVAISVPIGEATLLAYPDADGRFTLQVPKSVAEVTLQSLGRADQVVPVPADGNLGEIKVPAAARVRFAITDEKGADIPCKALFAGVDGTPNPNLGPRERAHGCRDQYHSETGNFTVALPPGSYDVSVVRGPEYGLHREKITLTAGQEVQIKASLKRQVDSTGWISADFHNHSTPSGDNVCDTDGRLISLAAENVEFAPTTEHNRLYDWKPLIEKLGLSPFLNTVKGMELTGRGQHFNCFPLEPVPYVQDNGAPVWNDDPRVTALTLRRWQGEKPSRWIQFNHPNLGYLFADRNEDGTVDGGFYGVGDLIDGAESQNFSDSRILSDVPFTVSRTSGSLAAKTSLIREFAWRQLLNLGHRLVAVAVCDAHYVYGNGVGGWRIYLPSKTDAPDKLSWDDLSPHAKAGHIILSSGPFLEVSTTSGAIAGDDVRGTGGIDLHVRVQCSDWIDVDRVQILVNSRPVPELLYTRESHPDWFGSGVVKFDRTIHVPLEVDAHVIVVADHRTRTLEPGFGTSDQAKLRPCAYNNPIYVDVDGNGFQPNYDTLDYPLSPAVISADQARRLLPPDPKPAEGSTDTSVKAKPSVK
ncbi:MAG: CehA/McbA family metallohydrolase, partial [Verrucomicrobiales bacterium]|nr:CehA/McbA family metallohydrolase [Verrucomicrobiales bacterium]